MELTDTELVWITKALKMDANECTYMDKWCDTILSKDEVYDLIDRLNQERIRLERR